MPLKKGQKLTDNPRNKRVELRLTESEYKMLDECCKLTGKTKTGVIVAGIKELLNKK